MFSYIGGKYRQAKWINSFFPKNVKYYAEVFGGAFWTYIKSNQLFEKVYYNDFNRFLVNVFECCKHHNEFIPYIDSTEPQDESIFNEFKNEVLEFEDVEFEIPNFELAHMYMYVMTQTFSGIMGKNVKMVDLKGKYNSKYNSFAKRLKDPRIQKKLEKIETSNLSYDDFIEKHDDDKMLLYLDPPYWKTENLYAFHSFGEDDHYKLSELLNRCRSKWILSYYEYPQLNDWYPKDKYQWEKKEYSKASMASKGKKQSKGEELLVIKGNTNNEIEKLY